MKTAWCKHLLWGNRDISGCRMSGHHGPDTSYDPGDSKLRLAGERDLDCKASGIAGSDRYI